MPLLRVIRVIHYRIDSESEPVGQEPGLAHGGELTHTIIGLAMRVHRHLGTGLLEPVSEKWLGHVLELKSVERALPLHEAQLLTYLRLSGCPIGALINFNTISLTDGIKRCAQSSRWTRSMRSWRSCASIVRVAIGRASSRRRPIGSSVSSQ